MIRILFLLIFSYMLTLPAVAVEPTYHDMTFGLRDGAMAFTAKTSLPDGSSVGVWIHQTQPAPKSLYIAVPLDYPQSMDLAVKDGAIIGVFRDTRQYGLPKGKYELVFTTPATGKNTQSHRLRITMPDDIPAQGWQKPTHDWNGNPISFDDTPRIPASEFRQRLIDAAKQLKVSGFDDLPKVSIGEKGATIKVKSWLFSLTPLDNSKHGDTVACTVFYDSETVRAVQKRLANVFQVLMVVMEPSITKKERAAILKKCAFYTEGGSTERNGLLYKVAIEKILNLDAVIISIAPAE